MSTPLIFPQHVSAFTWLWLSQWCDCEATWKGVSKETLPASFIPKMGKLGFVLFNIMLGGLLGVCCRLFAGYTHLVA